MASFAISYNTLRLEAIKVAAVESGWPSYLLPLILDGGVVAGSAVLWKAGQDRRQRPWFAYVFVSVLVLLSVVVNISHAGPSLLAKVVASLPPLVLLGCLELVVVSHRDDGDDTAEAVRAAQSVPAAQPVPAVLPVAATAPAAPAVPVLVPAASTATASATATATAAAQATAGVAAARPAPVPAPQREPASHVPAPAASPVVAAPGPVTVTVTPAPSEAVAQRPVAQRPVAQRPDAAPVTGARPDAPESGNRSVAAARPGKEKADGDASGAEKVRQLFAAHLQAGGSPTDPTLSRSFASELGVSAAYVRRILGELRRAADVPA